MSAAFPIASRVATPDGEGEVVGYDPAQSRPYYVFLSIPGTMCNVDCLHQYREDDLAAVEQPAAAEE